MSFHPRTPAQQQVSFEAALMIRNGSGAWLHARTSSSALTLAVPALPVTGTTSPLVVANSIGHAYELPLKRGVQADDLRLLAWSEAHQLLIFEGHLNDLTSPTAPDGDPLWEWRLPTEPPNRTLIYVDEAINSHVPYLQLPTGPYHRADATTP
jgi:hypothetical protein